MTPEKTPTETESLRALLATPTPDAVGALADYLFRRTDPVILATLLTAWAGDTDETLTAIEQAAAREYLRRGGRPTILLKLRELIASPT